MTDNENGPTVYYADGTWHADIPEATLRDLAEHAAELGSGLLRGAGWGAGALARAAKEALDRHDANQRREEWVEGATAEAVGWMDDQTLRPRDFASLRERMGRMYDRVVGTEER